MIERKYLELNNFIAAGQSVLILGPRGTGKTHYLSRVLREIANSISIDLLDARIFKRYLEQPHLIFEEAKRLIAQGKGWIFIDEVSGFPL